MSAPPTAQTQELARDALRAVGIDVDHNHPVVLTDGDRTGPRGGEFLVNPSQVLGAAEQLRLITGESIDGERLVAALPWKEPA